MLDNIFVNGTFDILHTGHLKLLAFAKSLGSQLIVAIDTDRRVKLLKGDSRPINNQQDRAFMLESLKYVDRVVFFDTDEELCQILETYRPDIMVKGSDYKGKNIVGSNYCKQILFYPVNEQYSTTKTIQSIITR